MDDHPLIDRYLDDLHRHLASSPRADAICSEARDHLLDAVERNRARGMDATQAQRRALIAYGDAQTVARAHAPTAGGHAAVPTYRTATAGNAGLAAAALWILIAAFTLEEIQRGALWMLQILASGLTTWLLVGLVRRHGGIDGLLGRGTALSTVLVLVSPIVTVYLWGVPAHVVLLAVAMGLFGRGLHDAGFAPPRAALLLAAGPLVIAGGFWAAVLREGRLPLPPPLQPFIGVSDPLFETYGAVPTACGLLVMASGLLWLGWWLRSEVATPDAGPATI